MGTFWLLEVEIGLTIVNEGVALKARVNVEWLSNLSLLQSPLMNYRTSHFVII